MVATKGWGHEHIPKVADCSELASAITVLTVTYYATETAVVAPPQSVRNSASHIGSRRSRLALVLHSFAMSSLEVRQKSRFWHIWSETCTQCSHMLWLLINLSAAMWLYKDRYSRVSKTSHCRLLNFRRGFFKI